MTMVSDIHGNFRLKVHDLRWIWGFGRLGTYPMRKSKEGALPAA
jgi:hypothetical protein